MRAGEGRFWLQWMLANVLAWAAGALLFWILVDRVLPFPLGPGGVAVGGALLGLLVGLAQWLVLRKRVPGAGWWVVTSILGGGLGLAASDALSHVGASVLILGAVIGAAQWLALRRWVRRAGWWVAVNMVAWLAGRTLAWTLITAVSLTASSFFDWGLGLLTGLVMGVALGGIVACALTGGALVWLLRFDIT